MTVWETEGVVASKKLRIAMLGHKRIPARKTGYVGKLIPPMLFGPQKMCENV